MMTLKFGANTHTHIHSPVGIPSSLEPRPKPRTISPQA